MKFIFLILTFVVLKGAAQTTPIGNEGQAEALIREGRFMKVTLVPGKPMKIFVAGTQRFNLDLEKLKLEVKNAGSGEKLEVNRDGNYYTVKAPQMAAMSEPKMIEVKTKYQKKSETFQFSLPKP